MNRPRFATHAASLLALACIAGCSRNSNASGSDTPGTTGGGSRAPCTTIPSPPVSQLPHIAATGNNAAAIEQALDAIFAAQTPPLSPGPAYTIPTLGCDDVQSGFGPSGNTCTLQVDVGSGPPATITLPPPSSLAQALGSALLAAGSTPGLGKETVDSVDASNMTVSASGVQYDDASCYAAFGAPNVTVTGGEAQSVIDAFAAAGVDDCDPSRYVFLVCSGPSSTARCSAQFMPLQMVGASDLLPLCMGEGETWPGPTFDAASSVAMWQAIQSAAASAGFQPMSGTLAESNVINARYFTWDGTSLTFTLVEGNATPPPTPPPDAGGP